MARQLSAKPNGSGTARSAGDTRPGWRLREKVLFGTTLLFLALAVVGFALYAKNYVPPSAAAKVNDFFVDESDVSKTISEQRARYGLENDSDFSSYLLGQGMNVYTYRQSVINQIALNMLIDKTASSLGCVPSDQEVDEQIGALRETNGAADDERWQEELAQQGVTEESLRAQLKTNLAEQAIYAAVIERSEANDEDVRRYIESALADATDPKSHR